MGALLLEFDDLAAVNACAESRHDRHFIDSKRLPEAELTDTGPAESTPAQQLHIISMLNGTIKPCTWEDWRIGPMPNGVNMVQVENINSYIFP